MVENNSTSWWLKTHKPGWQLNILRQPPWHALRELNAGLTTLVTMVYAVIVNPVILAHAGIPMTISFYGTCMTTALACLLMGVWGKSPLVIGPSMALNGYFITHLVHKFNGDWQQALCAVFLSGICLIIAALMHWPQRIREALPQPIIQATSIGIGLLIAHVAFLSANIGSVFSLKNINVANVLGISLSAGLMWLGERWRIRGHALIAILLSFFIVHCIWPTAIGLSLHTSTSHHISGWLNITQWSIVIMNAFVLAFLVIFDSTSTVLAITEKTAIAKNPQFNQQKRITLIINGLSTMLGAVMGITNMGVYFEGAAGIAAKGQSGWVAIIVAVGFLACLAFAPYLTMIPTAIPAGVLLVIALKITQPIWQIDWRYWRSSIPVSITIVSIPFTGAIADGIAFGLITYLGLNRKDSHIQKKHWLICACLIGYLILSKGIT